MVLTGGAGSGLCTDWVAVPGEEPVPLTHDAVPTRNDHGTGCTFGAATAAGLARGAGVPDALDAAKRFVHAGLASSAGWHLGAGHGPVGKLGAWSTAP